MISETDAAYIAGLFDGEGCVQFKDYREKKKKHTGEGYRYANTKRITLEVAMTCKSVIYWLHDSLGCGSVKEIDKTKSPTGKPYYKKQYRWRCSYRDSYYVALLIQPYVHVKAEEINNIIKHYSHLTRSQVKAKVIDIANYKMYRYKS